MKPSPPKMPAPSERWKPIAEFDALRRAQKAVTVNQIALAGRARRFP